MSCRTSVEGDFRFLFLHPQYLEGSGNRPTANGTFPLLVKPRSLASMPRAFLHRGNCPSGTAYDPGSNMLECQTGYAVLTEILNSRHKFWDSKQPSELTITNSPHILPESPYIIALSYFTFEVLTVLKTSMLVFWILVPRGLVSWYQHFRKIYSLHLSPKDGSNMFPPKRQYLQQVNKSLLTRRPVSTVIFHSTQNKLNICFSAVK
jgi:hypothetical protein